MLNGGAQPVSRRDLVAAGTTLVFSRAAAPPKPEHPLKIVVAGGHPGDPECGCSGTVARYAQLGHDVALLYLNRGEGYCKGANSSDCGTVRTGEAEKACQVLKARAVFAGQYDGRAIVDAAHYTEFHSLLEGQRPDIVFTQWPIDRHRDHRAVSNLALDWWLESRRSCALYFYEVAEETQMFTPAEFVDISGVEALRYAACFAHASQQPDKWYPKQVELTRFRGTASGFGQAEGFVRHWESRPAFLP